MSISEFSHFVSDCGIFDTLKHHKALITVFADASFTANKHDDDKEMQMDMLHLLARARQPLERPEFLVSLMLLAKGKFCTEGGIGYAEQTPMPLSTGSFCVCICRLTPVIMQALKS